MIQRQARLESHAKRRSDQGVVVCRGSPQLCRPQVVGWFVALSPPPRRERRSHAVRGRHTFANSQAGRHPRPVADENSCGTQRGQENVGIQFLSLRQRVLVQNSLSPFKRAKSPINTGLRTLTSGLRGRSGGPKFSLSGRFSPNLRTTRIWYGTHKPLVLNELSCTWPSHFPKGILGHREQPESNASVDCAAFFSSPAPSRVGVVAGAILGNGWTANANHSLAPSPSPKSPGHRQSRMQMNESEHY
jgi:hypothetical protein